MIKRDWHSQQKKNDRRVHVSLMYIVKLLSSDVLANHMDVSDYDQIAAMALEVQKIAIKYGIRNG